MGFEGDFDHIRMLEEELFSGSVRGNPAAVAAILADDFREFGRSGGTYTKAEVVSSLTSEATDERRSVVGYDYALRGLAAGVVLLTYRTTRQEGNKELHSLRSSIWQLADGRWRMVFHQGTPTTGGR